MNAETTFRTKTPGIIARLLGDFPIAATDGFAITGNLGHESLGFTALQEIKPTITGSRGGWGWPQWTGPRRRAFEAYCKRNQLDPTGDKANYSYLFIELTSTEKKALPATRAAIGLRAKVEAFERGFLRAGVKAYDARLQWARIAESAWALSGMGAAPTPIAEKKAILVDEAKASGTRATKSATGAAAGVGGEVVTGANSQQFADLLLLGLSVGLAALIAVLVVHAVRNGRKAVDLSAAAAKLEAL